MENGNCLIGVDLGGTNMRAGLIEDGQIVELKAKLVNKTGTAIDILEDLYKILDGLVSPKVMGIGIGVPSIVDVEKGIVYDIVNIPQWKEMHLKSLLESRYGIPVYVNNDANCFAAGEKYFGKAMNCRSFIGLIIGTGMGAGVVINNRVFEGRNCGAGEFGCMAYLEHNYEYYCSGQFFPNVYKISALDASSRACKGDPEAIKMYEEFGKHIGKAIQAILYAYDPEMIVLGGSVSKSFDLFKDSMYQSLADGFLFKKTLKSLSIQVSEVNHVAIYGAASLYYNNHIVVEK